MKKTLLVVSSSLVLNACANEGVIGRDAQITQDWSVEEPCVEAQDGLNSDDYTRAVKLYEILESCFPNGHYAQRSQLGTVYTYYKDDEPEKALAAIVRSQRHHPRRPNMGYALYLKGLVLFSENQPFLNKLASQDWSDRGPRASRDAYQVLAELVQRYPDSKYTVDATGCMAKLVDALNGNEVSMARYYVKRGAYVAAANRAQKVVSRYQNTRYIEEALAMMELVCKKLDEP